MTDLCWFLWLKTLNGGEKSHPNDQSSGGVSLGSGSRVDLLRLGPALLRGWPETQTSCLTSLIPPPGPGLSGLHAPAEAIYHSQVLEHHS